MSTEKSKYEYPREKTILAIKNEHKILFINIEGKLLIQHFDIYTVHLAYFNRYGKVNGSLSLYQRFLHLL